MATAVWMEYGLAIKERPKKNQIICTSQTFARHRNARRIWFQEIHVLFVLGLLLVDPSTGQMRISSSGWNGNDLFLRFATAEIKAVETTKTQPAAEADASKQQQIQIKRVNETKHTQHWKTQYARASRRTKAVIFHFKSIRFGNVKVVNWNSGLRSLFWMIFFCLHSHSSSAHHTHNTYEHNNKTELINRKLALARCCLGLGFLDEFIRFGLRFGSYELFNFIKCPPSVLRYSS